MPLRTTTLSICWPEPIAVLKHACTHLASAAVFAVVFRVLPQWIANPGLPRGFTVRGLVGAGLMLGGLYNGFTSVNDSGDDWPPQKRSDKDRYRLVRWGLFGGLGMMFLGVYTLDY